MLRLVESIKWRGEAVTWADLQREWQGVAALVPFGTEWAVYNAGAGAAARFFYESLRHLAEVNLSADGSRRPANSVAALVEGYDAIVEQLRRAPEGTRGVVVISRDPGGAELAVDVIHVAGHVVFVDVARGTLAELPVSPHFLQFLRVPAEQGAGASVDNLHATPGADDTGVGSGDVLSPMDAMHFYRAARNARWTSATDVPGRALHSAERKLGRRTRADKAREFVAYVVNNGERLRDDFVRAGHALYRLSVNGRNILVRARVDDGGNISRAFMPLPLDTTLEEVNGEDTVAALQNAGWTIRHSSPSHTFNPASKQLGLDTFDGDGAWIQLQRAHTAEFGGVPATTTDADVAGAINNDARAPQTPGSVDSADLPEEDTLGDDDGVARGPVRAAPPPQRLQPAESSFSTAAGGPAGAPASQPGVPGGLRGGGGLRLAGAGSVSGGVGGGLVRPGGDAGLLKADAPASAGGPLVVSAGAGGVSAGLGGSGPAWLGEGPEPVAIAGGVVCRGRRGRVSRCRRRRCVPILVTTRWRRISILGWAG